MIKPLGERIVVKVSESDLKTASGKPQQGEVLAVGSGKVLESGQVAPMEIKVGDQVLFAKYSGSEVKVDDQNLLIIRQSDVLAVL